MVRLTTQMFHNVPCVVILGLYRSGSSCLAGALDAMGITMGEAFHAANIQACPTGTYEAQALCEICWKVYDEPFPKPLLPAHQVVGLLSTWLASHRFDVNGQERWAGIKHPLLCALVPELKMASPNLRFVSIERDLDVSIQSLQSLKWWNASVQQIKELQTYLYHDRQRNLRDTDHYVVAYDQLLENTRGELEDLARYLGYVPSEEQLDRSARFVDSSLKRF